MYLITWFIPDRLTKKVSKNPRRFAEPWAMAFWSPLMVESYLTTAYRLQFISKSSSQHRFSST
jgi:hypothetical protein